MGGERGEVYAGMDGLLWLLCVKVWGWRGWNMVEKIKTVKRKEQLKQALLT